jgi:hypothetical protein
MNEQNVASQSGANEAETSNEDESSNGHSTLQLWQSLRGNKISDKMKTPRSKISPSACLTIGIHQPAIAVAITIAVLNLQGLWIGSELTGQQNCDTAKLLSLQFTAKLYELLVLESFSHMLYSLDIGELVFGDGSTLGEVRQNSFQRHLLSLLL